MALNLSKSTIITGNAITAAQITQSIDALTGVKAYDLTISGSLNINNAPITNLTALGTISASGTIIGSNLSGTNTGDQDLGSYMLSANTASFAITSSDVLFSNITASGNISASGGDIMGNVFANNPPGVGVNQISVRVANRIDLSPNNTTAIRLTDSLVTLNKDTSINGEITAVTNITASGNISSSGNIITDTLIVNDSGGAEALKITTSGVTHGIRISGSSNSYSSLRPQVKTITNRSDGDRNTSIAESIYTSGTVIFIDCGTAAVEVASNDIQLTLPAVSGLAGHNLQVYQSVDAVSTCEVKIVGPSNVLQGLIVNQDSNEVITNRTNIVIGGGDSNKGDRYDLICDGTNWYVNIFRQGVAADTTLS